MIYRKCLPAEIRAIFNEQEYWERAQRGDFVERELWRGKKRRRGELRGHISVTIGYFDHANRIVARVHQNVNARTGRIRGRPDPITLKHHGVLYDASAHHG